ncbi:MAG: 2-oxoglutarate dehydrogenase E1 component [Sumerlaeia bacterium]
MPNDHGPSPSLNGWNAEYVLSQLAQFKEDPTSVDDSWRHFFQGFELAQSMALPTDENSSTRAIAPKQAAETLQANLGNGKKAENFDSSNLQSKIDSLIYHYRDVGHMQAKIDPLNHRPTKSPLLALDAFELSEANMDQVFYSGQFNYGNPFQSLREILHCLNATYCESIGVEYMDIQNTPERRWLQLRMEPNLNQEEVPAETRIRAARLSRKSTAFEKFIHSRYVGQKRFSLEGAENLIPVLDQLINVSAEHIPEEHNETVEQVVLGMAHRGRLNVLANTLNKSYPEIFTEFEDNHQPDTIMGDGDVKYHKGYSRDYTTPTGKTVHLSLTANPSHLEAVDPVVLGRVRAKQRNLGDANRTRVLGILIHGDAAFAGQGIVSEVLNLSQLDGYKTGGTIHVIINNQIGFTTLPKDARSGDYCTDVAKMIQAPIFHVNGDDADACLRVARMAAEFRAKFKKDVVIDIYCYRRHGHNEGDEPSFTQPTLYEEIKVHPSPYEIYNDKLLKEGILTQEQIDQIGKELDAELEAAHEAANAKPELAKNEPFHKEWEGFENSFSFDQVKTSVAKKSLLEIADSWTSFPEGFVPHRKVVGIMNKRREAVVVGKAIDWAGAEALAIGSLLVDNVPVRISGQDSRRGTFSHRHAVVWDAETGQSYIPMKNIREKQARFCVYDSCLSEAGVLGFDYGYSLDNPNMMICWEAQFGDFANGAQTIIDQFICTSESKWRRASGLVMLLPHGYEGQGPEHSSGWLERFLQLSAENNIQVCNMTTPAQLFHVLRRQFARRYRKPLVIMSPKSGLRHPKVISPITDFTNGEFNEILDDTRITDAKKVKRLVLCSGKVYFDLLERAEAEDHSDVALIRVEQIYPFHTELMEKIIKHYTKAEEFVWCQEETQNKGAWSFIDPLFREEMGINLTYVGRERAASPAVGSLRIHKLEQQTLIDEAFAPLKKSTPKAVKKSA